MGQPKNVKKLTYSESSTSNLLCHLMIAEQTNKFEENLLTKQVESTNMEDKMYSTKEKPKNKKMKVE